MKLEPPPRFAPSPRKRQALPTSLVLRGLLSRRARCPFCRSEDIRRSSSQPQTGIARRAGLALWRCNDCHQHFLLRGGMTAVVGGTRARTTPIVPPCPRCGSSTVAPSIKATAFLRDGWVCLSCRRRYVIWHRFPLALVAVLVITALVLAVLPEVARRRNFTGAGGPGKWRRKGEVARPLPHVAALPRVDPKGDA